jgi:hypothetical protein
VSDRALGGRRRSGRAGAASRAAALTGLPWRPAPVGDSPRAHSATARRRADPAHAGPRPLSLLPPYPRATARPNRAPRAYSADVIGAPLLAAAHGTSLATTAADLGVPAGTLRD